MKVKVKVLILASLSVIILALVTSLIFYSSYFGYIKQNEEETIKNPMKWMKIYRKEYLKSL